MEIYAASYLLPMVTPPIPGGALAVDNGKIVAAGQLTEVKKSCNGPVIEYPGSVIMPGLVNAHTHLELTHYPAWKIRKDLDYSPRTYVDWIIQVIKIRRNLSLQELELSVREGLRICLEAGTTTVGEIVSDRRLLPMYRNFNLVGRLFLEAIGHDSAICSQILLDLEKCLATLPDSDFGSGISPHAPHTVSDEFFQRLKGLAYRKGLPVMVHLSESLEEAAFMHDGTGKIADLLYPYVHWEAYLPPPRRTTSIAHLDSLGILDGNTLAVHCVHINRSDIDILYKRNVTAVLCPRSNDKLAVGSAPAYLLKRAGIPMAIGTDSLASNDSLSMWDELRYLLLKHDDVFSAGEALYLATVGGARALGFSHLCGSLETGKRADFLIAQPDKLTNGEELHKSLVQTGKLLEVYLQGQPILAGGTLVHP